MEAARRRLLRELARFIACAADGDEAFNVAFHRAMQRGGQVGALLVRAHGLVGYPEWPGAVMRDAAEFVSRLSANQRTNVLLGTPLEAAVWDPVVDCGDDAGRDAGPISRIRRGRRRVVVLWCMHGGRSANAACHVLRVRAAGDLLCAMASVVAIGGGTTRALRRAFRLTARFDSATAAVATPFSSKASAALVLDANCLLVNALARVRPVIDSCAPNTSVFEGGVTHGGPR